MSLEIKSPVMMYVQFNQESQSGAGDLQLRVGSQMLQLVILIISCVQFSFVEDSYKLCVTFFFLRR